MLCDLCNFRKEPMITYFVRPVVTRRQTSREKEMFNNKNSSNTKKKPCVSEKYAFANSNIGPQLLDFLGFFMLVIFLPYSSRLRIFVQYLI